MGIINDWEFELRLVNLFIVGFQDRKEQRSSFRDILRGVEEGDPPSEKVGSQPKSCIKAMVQSESCIKAIVYCPIRKLYIGSCPIRELFKF